MRLSLCRDAVLRLHAELPPEAKLSFGVGIHYGDAVLGLIGTEKRLEYTAIGDSVNTAKRLQENAWHNQIVISQTAYERVRDYLRVLPMEPMQVKGKRESNSRLRNPGIFIRQTGFFSKPVFTAPFV